MQWASQKRGFSAETVRKGCGTANSRCSTRASLQNPECARDTPAPKMDTSVPPEKPAARQVTEPACHCNEDPFSTEGDNVPPARGRPMRSQVPKTSQDITSRRKCTTHVLSGVGRGRGVQAPELVPLVQHLGKGGRGGSPLP